MKKILKNKKGFTLIELLAVIVVLAIIMVIATQQVNKTIKKSRTNAFNETMQTVVKSAKLLIAESNLSTTTLQESLDYSDSEYDVEVSGTGPWIITLKPTSTGKFSNVDYSLMAKADAKSYCYNNSSKTITASIDDSGTVTSSGTGCYSWTTE